MCLFRFEIWISEYKNSKVYICITYPYIFTSTLLFVDICTLISLKKHSRRGQMSIISRHLENQRILTKSHITSIVFWIGKRMGFKSIVKKEKGIESICCSLKQSQRIVDTNSWISMFALFVANQKDFLASIGNIICSERKHESCSLITSLVKPWHQYNYHFLSRKQRLFKK